MPPPANGSRIGGGLPSRSTCEDLRVRLGEQRLVAGVLPDDEPLDDAVDSRSRSARWASSVGNAVGMRRRVVDELGEEHRARGGERSARPPQVQRRRVAVADRLLARRLPVDRLQRQRHLDQLALAHHGIVSSVGRHLLRTASSRPGRVPVAAMAGGVEVAGVEAA